MTVMEYANSYMTGQRYGTQDMKETKTANKKAAERGMLRRELADARAELSSLDRYASPSRLARAQAREQAARRALQEIA